MRYRTRLPDLGELVEWSKVDFKQILEEVIFKDMKFGYKYHKDFHLIQIQKNGGDYEKLVNNVIEHEMFRDCLVTEQLSHIAYLEKEIEEVKRLSKIKVMEVMESIEHIKNANEALNRSLASYKPWYRRIFG